MFFPGDTSSRKVSLSGRSKQPDRQKILEQARIERERRQRLRLENASASKIQKVFRSKRLLTLEKEKIREDWTNSFGRYAENAKTDIFTLESKFFSQLLFFCNIDDEEDLRRLMSTCELILKFFQPENETMKSIFQKYDDDGSIRLIQFRMINMSLLIMKAMRNYINVLDIMDQNAFNSVHAFRYVLFLNTLNTLSKFGDYIVINLAKNGLFLLFHDLFMLGKKHSTTKINSDDKTVLEFFKSFKNVLLHLSFLYFHSNSSPSLNDIHLPIEFRFSFQIGSIPLLWNELSELINKEKSFELWIQILYGLKNNDPNEIINYFYNDKKNIIKINDNYNELNDIYPPLLCLIGNISSSSELFLSLNLEKYTDLVINFSFLLQILIDSIPNSMFLNENIDEDNSKKNNFIFHNVANDLENQFTCFYNSNILNSLVQLVFPKVKLEFFSFNQINSSQVKLSSQEKSNIHALCIFLHTNLQKFKSFKSRIQNNLVASTNIIFLLWKYFLTCIADSQDQYPIPSNQSQSQSQSQTSLDPLQLNLLLPLSLFYELYSYMLLTMDIEEFIGKNNPVPLNELPLLVSFLKELAWKLIAEKVNSSSEKTKKTEKSENNQLYFHYLQNYLTFFPLFDPHSSTSILNFENVKENVLNNATNLLSQLHDRNNQKVFTERENFYVKNNWIDSDVNYLSNLDLSNQNGSSLCYALNFTPYLIPFSFRLKIFAAKISSLKNDNFGYFSNLQITVRKNKIIEDSFSQLKSFPSDLLKKTIRIKYINEFGEEEAGVDGGGLFKDFIENFTRLSFNVEYGLFKETGDHRLYPNPSSHLIMPNHLNYFEFLGKILGKAMLEGILVDIPFATFFLSKLKKKRNFLNHLSSLDPELYNNLLFLKHYEGDISELGVYFEIESNEFGTVISTQLIPNGKERLVTNENVLQYVWLVANNRLNLQIWEQSEAFLNGFQEMIDPELIKMFDEKEIQMLISGSKDNVDMHDLREHCTYTGGYHKDHPVILILWDILLALDKNEQSLFLKFVTGCSRGPLMGFRHLEPKFCIQKATPDVERLPTASTCMNLLKLPPYPNKKLLKEKLLYSINAEAGFDLS